MQTFVDHARKWGWFGFVGLSYFVTAIAALKLSDGPNDTATIWAPSGIVLGALLVATRGAYRQILAAVAAASISANLASGSGLGTAVTYTGANVLETLISMGLVRVITSRKLSFSDPMAVRRFAIVVVSSSTLSTAAAVILSGEYSRDFIGSWFMTVLLGQLIFAPLVVTIRRKAPRFFSRNAEWRLGQAVVPLALVVGTSLAVFSQSDFPVLFVPVLPILFATYRFGPLGAAFSVLIVAAIGSVATMEGMGPCAQVSAMGVSPITFLQLYLVTLLVAALPLAAALAARDTSYNELKRQKGFFEMASQTAHIGHWRLVMEGQKLTWSDEVFRIHGLPIGAPPPLESAIEAYHPDDRDMVDSSLSNCIENGVEFEFDARIITPQGEVRHVNSRGRAEVDGSGKIFAVFGVFQDISQRVKVNQQLESARQMAVDEAKHARVLANTDQLTGLPNRRRTMAEFEAALKQAEAAGTDLVVAVLDVDHFKVVNDNYGHAMGDRVLREVADIGTGCLRSTDTFGRSGGEEFLVVLPGANVETAQFVAERIRMRVMEISEQKVGMPAVTTSIGLAEFKPGMSLETLFQSADRALYDAKHAGRNLLKVA